MSLLLVASLVVVAPTDAGPDPVDVAAQIDVDALQRACDGGDGASCAKLAAAFASGNGVPHKNLARARSLYDDACSNGDAAACTQAGLARETGALATGVDPEAAHDVYVKGCDGGDRDACMRAASYEAIAKMPEAKAHFEKACTLGDVYGCTGFATLIRKEAPNEAMRLYRKACDARIEAACFALSRLCGDKRVPVCVDVKAPPRPFDDGRAHGHTTTDAFSFAVPPGTRLVDVVRDAKIRRRYQVVVDVNDEGSVELVPERDDVDYPATMVGELKLEAPVGPTNVAACTKVDRRLFEKYATLFATKLVDSVYGTGCEFRMLGRGRTRIELHLLVVGLDGQRAFAIVVFGENEPADAVMQAVRSSLKRGPK